MDEIYTVTVLNGIGKNRCVGWFENAETAVSSVLANDSDMEELRWGWAVVEKVGFGIYSGGRPVFWAEWCGDRWEQCARPDWAEKVIGFGIG